MLIVNLAVSDIIMMASNGAPLTYNVFFSNYWIFGRAAKWEMKIITIKKA